MSCGAETEANTLLDSLTDGDDFEIPDVDLSGPEYQLPDVDIGGEVAKLTNEDLTTKVVDGTGTFDFLMSGFSAHLKGEYDKNRITGAEYTKAYIALTDGAMGNAVQFLLGKDQAFWQAIAAKQAAILASIQVVTARVQLNAAKVELAKVQLEALTAKATYGLTKMKISTESMAYCTAKYQLDFILPQQLMLIKEQTEAQRGQTSNTRTDGAQVQGTLGKQRDLYDQQIVSYKRDSEIKAAKMFVDAWITQKTIDEGLLPPDNFANPSLNAILGTLKANNNLG